MTPSNLFLIDSTSLGPVLQLDPINSHQDNNRIEFHYIFRIPFNYLDSDFLPLTFHMEDGKRRSQLCYYEHDLFIPHLTQNNQGTSE